MYKKIGIIREGKQPPDKRTALTPKQCKEILHMGVDIIVQRSPVRAYTDAEYTAQGLRMTEDLTDRDLIIGVKEIPHEMLMAEKSYLIFSHVIKKQPHNKKLLRTVLDRKITLIDHELLTDTKGERVLAFGKWAGVVGAYNAFRAWEATHGPSTLRPAHQCHDRAEMELHLLDFKLPEKLRIVITGGGRVGKGAMEVLDRIGMRKVEPAEFVKAENASPIYTVLGSSDLYHRLDGKPFDRAAFHADPSGHRSDMMPFANVAHIYMACHFWDPRGPKILTAENLRTSGLELKVVADLSCDIGGPIDSTLRSSTIADPLFGYDPRTGLECAIGSPHSITVMSVDNLPCELPRDASKSFGRDLMDRVLPHLLGADVDEMIARATIAQGGKLTERFHYLKDYVGEV